MILSPKEKALDLYYSFAEGIWHNDEKDKHANAIICALIAVDEMISEAARMKSSYMGRKRYEYLLEVKQEIEKL